MLGAGIAQSVQCLTTDWTTGVRSPEEAKDFSSSLCVQTSSVAHPASCTMRTGGSFPGRKARPGRDADHSPHLAKKKILSRNYIASPPWHLHGGSGTAFILLYFYSVS
jgi:hypothetical protein